MKRVKDEIIKKNNVAISKELKYLVTDKKITLPNFPKAK